MRKLHDVIKAIEYTNQDLDVYLVCLQLSLCNAVCVELFCVIK